LLAVLLLPAALLHLKAPVDWGDDNFQYLSQARNLAEGIHSTETGFIYKDYARGMGPPAYPPGFPILLSPLLAFGLSPYTAALALISVCLFISGILFFAWSRNALPFAAAAFLTLAVFYNPQMLRLKSEIMSDIPFFCFLLAAVFCYELYRKEHLRRWLFLSAALAGFSICIRSVGWVWVMAVGAYVGMECLRSRFREVKQLLADNSLYLALALLVYFMIQVAWLPVDTGSSYGGQFFNGGIAYLVRHNFPQYVSFWDSYFTRDPLRGTGAVLLLLSLAGIWVGKRFIFHPAGWFAILHFILLIAVWPHFAYRYYMPVAVFLFFFSVYALNEMLVRRMGKWQPVLWIILAAGVAWLYVPSGKKQMREVRMADGPFCPECAAAWSAISEHTQADDVVAFHRPRALYFLTRRRSFILPETNDMAALQHEMEITGSRYILIDKVNREYQQSAEAFAADTLRTAQLWANSRFELYRLR